VVARGAGDGVMTLRNEVCIDVRCSAPGGLLRKGHCANLVQANGLSAQTIFSPTSPIFFI
jgi:hypothetical protein